MIASKGEVDVDFKRDKWSVKFKAIVVDKLNSDIYGGMNFMVDNDITMRPKKLISVGHPNSFNKNSKRPICSFRTSSPQT